MTNAQKIINYRERLASLRREIRVVDVFFGMLFLVPWDSETLEPKPGLCESLQAKPLM